MSSIDSTEKLFFLRNGSEMSNRIAQFDWSSTPLGPVTAWPDNLKTVLGIVLHSDFPMFVWWGEDMIQFYNDAYRPSLGNNGKHPAALGQKGRDCWPEIWDTIFPLITTVRETGNSFFLEDQLIPIYRNGALEDVYWTFSYSAIKGKHGTTDGILVICNETTQKVLDHKEVERSRSRADKGESNLRNIILQSPVPMAILRGPTHIVEIANRMMFALWGRSAEEMQAKPVFDVLTTARTEGFENLLNNVYATGQSYTAYAAPVTLYRDGLEEIAYIHFVYEPWRDDDGSVKGVMVAAIDVTKEILTQLEVEQGRTRLRNIVDNAPFPIGVYEGEEMRIVMVNQSIIDTWGKGSDVVGKTYFEVLPELATQNIYPLLRNVYKTGVPYRARHQRVDLTIDSELKTFYFNFDFTPLRDADGTVYGVMNTAADVTDLNIAKQRLETSERNFRYTIEQSPVAMCIMRGPTHIVEAASSKMIELWGKPREAVMNKPIFEGLPDARAQGLEELLDHVYITGQTFHADERPVNLVRFGQPETVFQNFVYEPYRSADGVILGVVAITMDVTAQVVARHKIEDVVAERTERLRKSNEELSQFAYITSHDLQEPARKIGIFVEKLQRTLGPIDSASQLLLQKIDAAGTRMLELIRGILDISRLSPTEELECIDLNVVLDEALTDYEVSIEEKSVRLERDTLPTLYAIPVQMSLLFGNLISNAIKFSNNTQPVIRIKCDKVTDDALLTEHHLDPRKLYYAIRFEDNGIGFDESQSKKIFQIFQRLHAKSEYKGTGIGLATCKKIMENHAGVIFANSVRGVGSVFTIIIPDQREC